MKIKLKLHPNSSQEKIKRISEDRYEVWLREKLVDNKANEKLLKILRKYFGKSIKIVKGVKSREKVVEIK